MVEGTLIRSIGKMGMVPLATTTITIRHEDVYEMPHAEKYRSIPSYAARCELRCLVGLAPLIEGSIKREFSQVILCIDASSGGGGVVYTPATPRDYKSILSGHRIGQWVEGKPWKTAIRHRWKRGQHINVLEGKALVLGIRWLLRSQKNHGKRCIIRVDNQALIRAVEKGRSSLGLHSICRQVAPWSSPGTYT